MRLVWPLALGMLNNAVLQFTDGVFLARESTESLAASLPASMLSLVITGFFQSVTAYSGTLVAQYSGAGDARGVEAARRAGLLVALASGVLAAAAVPFGLALAAFASPNPEVVSRTRLYYAIVSFGAVALCGQTASAAYFTGLGRTRIVFWANLAGNMFNIALDPLLIYGLGGFPRMGMAGAGVATVAALFFQWGVLELWRSRRDGRISPRAERGKAVWGVVRKILRYGVPSGVYSVLNVVTFAIFVFATGAFGEQECALSNACFKVNYLLIAPMEGFALAAATLVGQAQGRGDSRAAHAAAMRCLVLGVALVAAASALAVVFYRPVLSLFVSPGTRISTFYSTGFSLFILMAAWQVFDAADVIVSGALKGAGDTKFVMWWMVAASCGFWMPLVWAAAAFCDSMVVLWATMVAYVVVICAGTLLRWRGGRWRRIKMI